MVPGSTCPVPKSGSPMSQKCMSVKGAETPNAIFDDQIDPGPVPGSTSLTEFSEVSVLGLFCIWEKILR